MAADLLKRLGAKRIMPLAVSAPFHCELMKPAAERLRERLAATALLSPRIPVVNNIDVAAESDPDRIRDALYRQAFGPVRWVEVVAELHGRGLLHIFECGPGRVLSKIVKRIEHEGVVTTTVLDPRSAAEARGWLA
jgi:[acyl-carrier-protein] S-malonyltransferase